ncbi:MAG TPA: NTP transferase domain-containing protein [Thermoleophilia bacterium]|nr:NTP transferase domain-containing protein [Thermoleophilia bacterium]HQG04364.1 NTP transferase domain-containing protein [Thermoleophilia bacterium]HQJ97558.1 NTP transferase domain-containing protein [Thermoleophilia bacterium]
MSEIAAIVLAAGYSSRMGSLKPLLEVEGRTLLERAVHMFRDIGVDDVIVVVGHRGDEVRTAAEESGARPVWNLAYDEGMYSSIQAGTAALQPTARWFFVLPGDCAFVRPETVGRLARAGRDLDVEVVLPVYRGATGHPPMLRAALKEEILAERPREGLRELLESHAAHTACVTVADPAVRFDADTESDLARAREFAAATALPGEARCFEILRARGASPELVAHSRAVAAVGTALATALNEQGRHVCLPLVVAAALLHDVARGEPMHADTGAVELEAMGFPRVAAVVRRHMDLGDGGDDTRDVDEAGIVYLADKMVAGDQVVALEDRLVSRLRDLAGDPVALDAARRRMEAAVEVRCRIEDLLGKRVGPARRADVHPG